MYKYNFHHLLRQLSYDDYQISWKFFPQALNISESTWKQWIYIKKGDKREVPFCALVRIATFFDVKVNDLIANQKVRNMKQEFKNFKV